MRFIRENTFDKKDRYREALLEILDRADILDAKAILAIRALVRDLQYQVTDRMTQELGRVLQGEGTFGLWWIQRIQNALFEVVAEMSERTSGELSKHLVDAYKIGAEVVDTGATVAKGIEITSPIITARTLTVVAPFSAQLITAITDSTRDTIDKAIRRSVLLGESPYDLMTKIRGHIGTEGTPFRSVAYRAEMITRTELSRVQNLASEARTRQLVQEFPEILGGDYNVKQQYVAVQRGIYPCKICAPDHGKIFEINDPNKPEIPRHPLCFCKYVNHYPGISSIVEPIVRRQVDKSLTKEPKPRPKTKPKRTTEAHNHGCKCCH